MIYNTASVVLAGLISIVSAASVQHAPKSHNALVATEHPTQLVKKINKNDYTEACFQVWETFDKARCWCYTGCALDCSQGGDPNTPGNQTNSEWCQGVQPWVDCRTSTFDLMDNCKDADRTIQVDGAAPGVDKIAETAGYQRADVPPMIPNAIDGHVDVKLTYSDNNSSGFKYITASIEVYFPATNNTITEEAKYDIFYDGEKIVEDLPPSRVRDPGNHNGKECVDTLWINNTLDKAMFDWLVISSNMLGESGSAYASDHDAVDKFTIAMS